MFEPCPGCLAEFRPRPGPAHRYIGAHAGCWALYSDYLGSGIASPSVLQGSRVRPWTDIPQASRHDLDTLLIDAYAAQHHGTLSPQAVQSVAVHLLVLYGVLRCAIAVEQALWVRRRALRVRGVFHWLQPPERGASLALRHLALADPAGAAPDLSAYVESVFTSWQALHEGQLADWYARFVLADAPDARAL